MIDADQIQLALARFAVGAQQIFRAQFIARAPASPADDIIQRQRNASPSSVSPSMVPIMAPQHSFG